MKLPAFIFFALTGLAFSHVRATAQDLAPSSLTATALDANVTSATQPFASNGTYRVFTAPFGSNFVALGNVEGGLSGGFYSYAKTGTNSGTAQFVDAQSGRQVFLSLTFNSPSSGLLTWSNAGEISFQTAAFTETNYTVVAAPQFYLPAYSNGVFASYLSGQSGGIYSLQTSSNLIDWEPFSSLELADVSGPFADTNAGLRFYRAQTAEVDYAPAAIAGASLNFTVATGAGSFATNGFFQLLPAATNSTYQEQIGPVLANTPGGVYQYQKTGPGAATIATIDSAGVTNFVNIVFTSPTAGFFYSTNRTAAQYQAGSFSTASGPVAFLGNYRFTPDASRAASLTFPADGSPATLSVTDASSNTWTLNLPADALLGSRTITMTPTASVDASGAVMPSSAAVLLQPDGIQFDDGVTLTVTTPVALGTNATLMNAALDGSQLSFAVTSKSNNTCSTTLFHFSSAALSNPSSADSQNLQANAQTLIAQFNQAVSDAKALASRVPPPPPPDGYFCDLSDAEASADDYYAEVFARDLDVVGRLQSAAAALAESGLTSYQEQAGIYVGVVFQRDVLPRTLAMIGFYGKNLTELPVVASAAFKLVRWAQFNGATQTANILAELSAALVGGGNTMLNQLTVGHQYSAASSILPLIKVIRQAGGDPTRLLAEFPGAMSFQLTIDVVATSQFVDDISSVSTATEARGMYPIMFDLSSSSLQGNGTCDYLSGVDTETTTGLPDETGNIVPGQSFTVSSTLTFQDCPPMGAGMVTLTFSQLGSPDETWNFPPPEGTLQLGDMLNAICGFVYSTTGNYTSPGFSFALPLQEGDAQAVNFPVIASGQLPGNGPSEEAALTITLTHTPQ